MILITGTTGHIGNVLVRQLAALGRRLRALVLPGESLRPLGAPAPRGCQTRPLHEALIDTITWLREMAPASGL